MLFSRGPFHYHPIYTYITQVISFLEVFQLKLHTHFQSPHAISQLAHPVFLDIITLIYQMKNTNYEAHSTILLAQIPYSNWFIVTAIHYFAAFRSLLTRMCNAICDGLPGHNRYLYTLHWVTAWKSTSSCEELKITPEVAYDINGLNCRWHGLRKYKYALP
jgi:hypothetical protein